MSYRGRRVTSVIDYDVWVDSEGKDHWVIEEQEDINDAVKGFIKSEELNLERELTFEEVKILNKFATYLENR